MGAVFLIWLDGSSYSGFDAYIILILHQQQQQQQQQQHDDERQKHGRAYVLADSFGIDTGAGNPPIATGETIESSVVKNTVDKILLTMTARVRDTQRR